MKLTYLNKTVSKRCPHIPSLLLALMINKAIIGHKNKIEKINVLEKNILSLLKDGIFISNIYHPTLSIIFCASIDN